MCTTLKRSPLLTKRLKNVRVQSLLAALVLAVAGLVARPGSAKILFLAHFDGNDAGIGANGDYAFGNRVAAFANGIDVEPGVFGDSMNFPTGATNDAGLYFHAPGNIHVDRGTVDFWWIPSFGSADLDTADSPRIFGVNYAGTNRFIDLYMQGLPQGKARFAVFSTVFTNDKYYPLADAFEAGTPFHIAFTWDEDRGIELFVNGTSLGFTATTWNSDLVSLNMISVGSGWDKTSSNCAGRIDEFRISDQVAYVDNFSPPTSAYVVDFDAPSSNGTAMLTRDGVATSLIVTAAEPTRSAQFAAAELKWHVKEMTGAELPEMSDSESSSGGLQILVGESRATQALGYYDSDFQSQEYTIDYGDSTLILMGKDDMNDKGAVIYREDRIGNNTTWPDFFRDHATCYAVYDFLQKSCNVRWYYPHDVGMVLDQTNTLDVDVYETRRTPAMGYRQPMSLLGNSENWDSTVTLWPKDSTQFHAIEDYTWQDLYSKWGDSAGKAKMDQVRLYMYRLKMGGEAYACNHSFYGYYDRFWEPNPDYPNVWEEPHPEWFASGYEGLPPQMDYADEAFIDQVISDAQGYFSSGVLPHYAQAMGDYFALVPMDNSMWDATAPSDFAEINNPSFGNGRASDYFFDFANKVAKEIQLTHPDKMLSTLAYSEYAYPPKNIVLEDNVSVQLCMHFRNWFSPINEANDMKMIDEWGDYGGNPLYSYLYYGFPQQIAWISGFNAFPGFFGHTAVEQLALLHDRNFQGVFACGLPNDIDSYLVMRAFDDPSFEVDTVLDEFFSRYYGAAAAPMKNLYDAIEATYSDPMNYPEEVRNHPGLYHQNEAYAWGYLGTGARMDQFSQWMDEAMAGAATPEEIKRVTLFKQGIWDYMEEGRNKYLERLQGPSIGGYKIVPTRKALLTIPPNSPDGDPRSVDWQEATVLKSFFATDRTDTAQWRQSDGTPSFRDVGARIAHDGTYVYLLLKEVIDPTTVVNGSEVTDGDYWQVIVSDARTAPYRELVINAQGHFLAHEYAENGDQNNWSIDFAEFSEMRISDGWTMGLALPMSELVPGGAQTGDTIYLNIIRRSNSSDDQPMWVPSFDDFVNPARLGGIILESNPDNLPGVPTPPVGLVGYWPLDDSDGYATDDSSGNELTGYLKQGPQPVQGKSGSALYFEQQRKQHVEIADSSLLDLTEQLSLVAWIKPDGWWNFPAIIAKGYDKGAYSLHIRADWSLWFDLEEEVDGEIVRHIYNPTDLTVEPGVWNHVAATYDGAAMRVYVNGRQAGTGKPIEIEIRQTDIPLRIGYMGSYGTFDGIIDEVAVYDQALTPEQIFLQYRTLKPTMLLEDGFETNFSNWDDNGYTDWNRTQYPRHSGEYAAHAGWWNQTRLISDNLNTTGMSKIIIKFWYRDSGIDDDDNVYFQIFNGSTYVNQFELGNTLPENTWHEYETTIDNYGADSQYFRNNLRIKFESSSVDVLEHLWIDDVTVSVQ